MVCTDIILSFQDLIQGYKGKGVKTTKGAVMPPLRA